MLLLLAGLTLWLERTSQPDAVSQRAARHDPDYVIDNFTARRFDAEGKLYQTLEARQMRHYPDDDSTEADLPRMVYHTEQKTFLNSDTAWIDSGAKTIVLKENVRVTRENAKGPPTQITTSILTVLPDDEIARTQAPVTITQGQTVINGKGLEVNNKTQVSVLGGRVHGTIASQAK